MILRLGMVSYAGISLPFIKNDVRLRVFQNTIRLCLKKFKYMNFSYIWLHTAFIQLHRNRFNFYPVYHFLEIIYICIYIYIYIYTTGQKYKTTIKNEEEDIV